MLNQEEIEAFKKAWYSFEEIQKIQSSLKSIEAGKVVSHEYVKSYIDNELFGKYKVNV